MENKNVINQNHKNDDVTYDIIFGFLALERAVKKYLRLPLGAMLWNIKALLLLQSLRDTAMR